MGSKLENINEGSTNFNSGTALHTGNTSRMIG